MKQKLLFLISASLLCTSLLAQPVYNLENFAQPGQTLNVVFADSTYSYSPTPAGQNQTWNFADLVPVSTETIRFGSPAESAYINEWCFDNQIDTGICTDSFTENFDRWRDIETGYILQQFGIHSAVEHIAIEGNSVVVKMFGFNKDGQNAVLDYNDTDILYQFPMEYGNQFVDESSCMGSLSHFNLPIILNFYGTRTTKVDGTGTLILPNGTLTNVLRVTTQFRITTTLSYYGFPLSLEEIVYQDAWFHPAYGFPVMLAEYQYDDGELELGYLHYAESILSTPQFEQIEAIYPNPTTGIINTNKPIRVYNSIGQFMTSQPDLTGYANGIYFVQIQTGEVLKIIKQ